jgi:hypothetical protein
LIVVNPFQINIVGLLASDPPEPSRAPFAFAELRDCTQRSGGGEDFFAINVITHGNKRRRYETLGKIPAEILAQLQPLDSNSKAKTTKAESDSGHQFRTLG